MSENSAPTGPKYSFKTKRMIGRQDEIERLRKHLHRGGDKRFIYYYAAGGLGKTRLLLELQDIIQAAGSGSFSTGIIDLYHTDTHSTSDIEHAIADGVDPKKRFFKDYRAGREHYEQLRERGADPADLERHRAVLGDIFVRDWDHLAAQARKVVICFDTIELLQYESSVMEEFAGLDTVDARVKPWLLDKLPQLNNVLVVFAGRPKKPENAHQRLQDDMQQAFGKHLDIVPLPPLDLAETEELLYELSDTPDLTEGLRDLIGLLPVVHRLTRGAPIVLYLIADLLRLAPLRELEDLFKRHQHLADAPENDPDLGRARREVAKWLVNYLCYETGELGLFLQDIALMPKGVDTEILYHSHSLTLPQAKDLLEQLIPLSFVKRFVPPSDALRLHGKRLFLHEEMYDMLKLSGQAVRLRIRERSFAHRLVENYYEPQIAALQEQLNGESAKERAVLHKWIHKLQVERLYYLLVWDPSQGYEEYQALSQAANYERRVGYAMRLLDEFLRFFHASRESSQLQAEMDKSGITWERVVRDSTLMWIERFWWWGQHERVRDLGERILDEPQKVSIDPDRDLGILGNICGLWTRAYAISEGYSDEVINKAEAMLVRMPPLIECNPEQALARARLLVTIGYLRRLGGQLTRAIQSYTDSRVSFRQAGDYPDEYSMMLNNLAFAHAVQGRFIQARMLAHEALDMNEELGHDYATGLTLTTLAEIALRRGNYPRAIEYGDEALKIFQQIEDAHGTALAHEKLAKAARRLGKHETQVGRHLEEAEERLEEAIQHLRSAEEVRQTSGMGPERLQSTLSELGRAYRDMGNLLKRKGEGEDALKRYHEAQRMLEQALKTNPPGVERADIMEDLAEVLFMAGHVSKAEEMITEVEALIGAEYQIVPGKSLPEEGLPTEGFSPLGKAELLRGQIAFGYHRFEAGTQHYLLAYAYFMHFSLEAAELETLIRYLYARLRRLPESELQSVMDSVQKSVGEDNYGVDTRSFARILGDLLGT